MLDFTELPHDGEAFELLIRELSFITGFHPFWSGRGPDGGRDLLCDEHLRSPIKDLTRRWLVQCKHFAHGGRAVGVGDLDAITDTCDQHSAAGYLLVCSTVPSSAVVNRFEAIGSKKDSRLVTAIWDVTTIERLLRTPRHRPLAQRFFPKSATGWAVYATEHPNRWVANYRGHYFQLANRISSRNDIALDSIGGRLAAIEAISLPNGHFMRLRAVYYDDKHGHYKWFLDYMHPQEDEENHVERVRAELRDGFASEHDGQFYDFDILARGCNLDSDHFDRDHYHYYLPYLYNFERGLDRTV